MRYVYRFGKGNADGNGQMRELLGGKGANLAEMTRLGLPVPAGFTITTEACLEFQRTGRFADGLDEELSEAVEHVEECMGTRFGDSQSPLLLSCRSGARSSMPGMMDTVLNLGLNRQTLPGLVQQTGDERSAWDSYRRLVQIYGDVVLELRPAAKSQLDPFESILDDLKQSQGVEHDYQLSVPQLQELVVRFQELIEDSGKRLPEDPWQQLVAAIKAVFASWNNDRAIIYRRQYGIPDDWGTACNIQAMVFGNLGDDCATGVALTREGSFGAPGLVGDYLVNAQGEDVVAGIRHTQRIEESLEADMPHAFAQLQQSAETLEKHFRDVQDIEFTIQHGKVWILQTRNAKRTGFAAVRIAVDMVDEGLITPREALAQNRIPANDLNHLLQPVFDPAAKAAAERGQRVLAVGIAASPGAASGRICLTSKQAELQAASDPETALILVRRRTSADDIRGMNAAAGVLTALGGSSSHAALVSRQMGRPCVVGCRDLAFDQLTGTIRIGSTVLHEGDLLSIDGFTGRVYLGSIETHASEVMQVLRHGAPASESLVYQYFSRVMQWADEFRSLSVRANCDKPDQAREASALGAEGIGLCRTEHMFFDHVNAFREMILADTPDERKRALAKLLPHQRDDFLALFRVMGNRPVNVRLLDPPLHEFLPHGRQQIELLAKQWGKSADLVYSRVRSLEEYNPMLGHRGCRLGIVYPEITAMQVRAIFEAACLAYNEGLRVQPEVMVPLVAYEAEIRNQAETIRQTVEIVFAERGMKFDYSIGTMIEIPRAAITADQIAKEAEFFSFGTNDLTQTTLGMSRDDSGPFLTHYLENRLLTTDPFRSIDQQGVGELMRWAVEKGRRQRPDLEVGICGEHGGDPSSVRFCHHLGLDYVSCSPRRLPIARLAAAQAALEEAQTV